MGMGGNKKVGLLIGVLLGQSALANTLPLISREQLQMGTYWEWTYYTNGNSSLPYSSERYRIVEVRGSIITFEISSRYDVHGSFTPNTRFRIDLSKCHNAFKNLDVKVNFLIELYTRENGEWSKTAIRTQATAFEEKFNCNPFVYSGRNSLYETRFESVETEGKTYLLFQQWPKSSKSQLRSFYYLDHAELRGVAFHKAFNPGTTHYYEMRLTDFGKE